MIGPANRGWTGAPGARDAQCQAGSYRALTNLNRVPLKGASKKGYYKGYKKGSLICQALKI